MRQFKELQLQSPQRSPPLLRCRNPTLVLRAKGSCKPFLTRARRRREQHGRNTSERGDTRQQTMAQCAPVPLWRAFENLALGSSSSPAGSRLTAQKAQAAARREGSAAKSGLLFSLFRRQAAVCHANPRQSVSVASQTWRPRRHLPPSSRLHHPTSSSPNEVSAAISTLASPTATLDTLQKGTTSQLPKHRRPTRHRPAQHSRSVRNRSLDDNIPVASPISSTSHRCTSFTLRRRRHPCLASCWCRRERYFSASK